MPTMGEVISRKLLVSFGATLGSCAETVPPVAGTAWKAVGAAVVMTGWKSVPFFRVILKPSFSILKTERSFFLIRAMSSLISFKSKVLRWLRLESADAKRPFPAPSTPLWPGKGKGSVIGSGVRTHLLYLYLFLFLHPCAGAGR